MDFELDSGYLSPHILEMSKKGPTIIKQVSIVKYNNHVEGPLTIVFEFINTKTGYKFYGFDRFG
jgi:hypothetical protein